MDAPQQFRVTLNRPYAELVQGGMGAIELERYRGRVRIRPTTLHIGPLVFPVQPRGERGGLQAIIQGKEAKAIWSGLIKMAGGEGRPFYSVALDADDHTWYALTPEPESPPRHIPALRLWVGPVDVEGDDDDAGPEPEWARMIRRSARVVAAYNKGGKIGRPSKEVTEARDVMAVFERLVDDLTDRGVDRDAVKRAFETLRDALG
jgi:hypothetical protein